MLMLLQFPVTFNDVTCLVERMLECVSWIICSCLFKCFLLYILPVLNVKDADAGI